MKSGNPNFLEPSGPLQACKGTALPYIKLHFFILRVSWNFKSLCQLYAPYTVTLQDFVVRTRSVFMDLVCFWNNHKTFLQRAGLFIWETFLSETGIFNICYTKFVIESFQTFSWAWCSETFANYALPLVYITCSKWHKSAFRRTKAPVVLRLQNISAIKALDIGHRK